MNAPAGTRSSSRRLCEVSVHSGVLEGERGHYRLVRSFSNTDVPPTVRAVLAARIDALPAAEKQLLQMASVLGREVPFTLLNAISGPNDDNLRRLLDSLQAAELLFTTRLFPDVQYTFKHALTQDVAYSGVLQERRREIHARVVETMERLYGDRLGEQVDRLARHAVQGGLHEKAVHYLRQAGAKAAARSARRTPAHGSSRLWVFSRRCPRAGPIWSKLSNSYTASACSAPAR